VQWKIAPAGRLVARFHRWAIRRGFPALAWLAPRAPRRTLLLGARWVIAGVMAVYPGPKRAIARNLGRVLGEPVDSPRVRRAVRRMLRFFAYSWVDLFRFGQLPKGSLRAAVVDPDDAVLAPIRAARDAGRRVILMTAHVGPWELGAVLAGQSDLPLAIVYVKDAFGEAERFRSLFRSAGDVSEIAVDPNDRLASLPILRAFEEGRVVALQGDRDFNDRGAAVELFGARTTLPLGPFQLARMTGAMLVPVFVTYAPDLRLEIEIGKPIEVERTTDRDGDARRALAAWVTVLEGAIGRWPDQWSTFHDVWPEAAGSAGSAGSAT